MQLKRYQPATYYYATDHLGSSSVLTNNDGSYYERLEYLPYGEVWVEDAAINSNYRTPYKFTGKELDKETGLYYFGARYYDARISRWISTDPALEKYFPKPNDYDTEHDFYWYILNDASGKLPGMGGVYNVLNLDMYHYAGNNPVKLVDPDGLIIATVGWKSEIAAGIGISVTEFGYLFQFGEGVETKVYNFSALSLTAGLRVDTGADYNVFFVDTLDEFLNESWVTGSIDIGLFGFGIGSSTENKDITINFSTGAGAGGSIILPGKEFSAIKTKYNEKATEMFKAFLGEYTTKNNIDLKNLTREQVNIIINAFIKQNKPNEEKK